MEGSTIRVDDLDDARLAPYWNLRERTLRGESIFIAEGALVVERLLRSPYEVESILIVRGAQNLDAVLRLASPDVPIYSVDGRDAGNKLLGFEFHQGVLALGRRANIPNLVDGMERYFSGESRRAPDANARALARKNDDFKRRRAWVVLPDATKPDNLGLVFRCAAALDAEGVVLGERCCDPFSRRALRVSMGGVLQTPIYQATNLIEEIQEVKRRRAIPFYATVLDDEAKALPDLAREFHETREAAFVFGNEYSGLSPEIVALCDQKVIIPMRGDVDSLNLGVSVGVLLYEFNRRV